MKTKLDNLVLGGSYEAFLYAFREGYPIIYKVIEKPFVQDDVSLKQKQNMEQMVFLMTLADLNLFANKVGEIRVDENNVTVTGKRPWKFELMVDHIHNFTNHSETKIKVVDYINVKSCGKHNFKYLKGTGDFVKEIIFVPSKRVKATKNYDVNSNKADWLTIHKDLCVVSHLTKKQIENEKYSAIYSRLFALQIMKDNGIKGKSSGNLNHEYCKPIRLEFSKREMFPLLPKIVPEPLSSKNIYIQKFLNKEYFK